MGASFALLRRYPDRLWVRVCAVVVDASLDLVAEVTDQALHRPGRAVAERTDGVALDLGCDFHQHVDLALVRAAFRHAAEHPPHPTHALAAGRALATALVFVEVRDAGHGADDICRFVHHDHGRGAEGGFELPGAVEIHEQMLAVAGRDQRHGGAAGNDREQVVPAAAHAAAMGVEQLPQRHSHGVFDGAGFLHVAGNAEQLGAGVVRPADAGEPGAAAPRNVRHHRDRFHVVDRGWAAVDPDIGRKRRFQARLALLAFEAFQQRRLLAADIGSGAVVDDDVERKAVDVVLADEIGGIGLVHRRLQAFSFADEFAADIDEAGMRAHGEAGDQAALDQEMWVVAHDLAVLAGAGLGFIGVDHEIMRPTVGLLGHERPFESGRKAGAAAPTQPRGLHLVDNPIAALLEDSLGAVPGTARAGALEAPIVEAIEILEDAILVREHHDRLFADESPMGGLGTAPSRTFAGAPAVLASASPNAGSRGCPPFFRA